MPSEPDRSRSSHARPALRTWGAVALLTATLLPARSQAIPPATCDARAIAEASLSRDTGDRKIAHLTMTITDSAGHSQVRELQTRSLRFDEGTRSLFLVEAPPEVRDTGVLSIDYRAGDRADDQWLYLPSLHRSTRISTRGKSGSFLGSDLTFADLTQRDANDYGYTLIEQDVRVEGQPCWVIEARPRNDRVQSETGYVKTWLWISKSTLLPLQTKHWIAAGRKLKYIQASEVEKVDGIWVAKKLVVRVVREGAVVSTTVLHLDSVRFDQQDVTPTDFTQQRLERGL